MFALVGSMGGKTDLKTASLGNKVLGLLDAIKNGQSLADLGITQEQSQLFALSNMLSGLSDATRAELSEMIRDIQ